MTFRAFRTTVSNFFTIAIRSSSLISGGVGGFAPLLLGLGYDFGFGGGCDFSQVLNPLSVGEPFGFDSQYALNCFQRGCFFASSKFKSEIDDDGAANGCALSVSDERLSSSEDSCFDSSEILADSSTLSDFEACLPP